MLLSRGWREAIERYRQQECERYRHEERKRRNTENKTLLLGPIIDILNPFCGDWWSPDPGPSYYYIISSNYF